MKNYKAVYYLVRASWGRWRWKLRGVYEKNADTAKMLHCLHNKERKLAYAANIYLAPLFSRSYCKDVFAYPGCQLKTIKNFESIKITRKLIDAAVALERGEIPVNPMEYGYYWFERNSWEFRKLDLQRKQAYQRKQQQLARCKRCKYYHESDYLKCAVNPVIPLDCPDFDVLQVLQEYEEGQHLMHHQLKQTCKILGYDRDRDRYMVSGCDGKHLWLVEADDVEKYFDVID